MMQRSRWIIQKTEIATDDGMVCTHHPAASEAAIQILERGGNAVDAAVAAGFAVGVAEPFNSGLGGIAQLVYRDAATGRVTVFDGTTVLPNKIHHSLFPLADPPSFAGMYGWPSVEADANNTGWLAPGVPGTPACLLEALARFGKLRRDEVLAPAISLARDGVEIDWNTALTTLASAARLAQFPATKAIYFNSSGIPLVSEAFGAAADFLRQPDLAWTLERLVEGGTAAYYTGVVAQRFAEQMAMNGGLITADDLAAYRLRVFDGGVTVPYRDIEATVAPQTGGGLTVVQALKLLDGFDLTELGWGSTAASHLLAEALRRVFLDRFRYLGDPKFESVPFAGLLADGYAAERRATIEPLRATPTIGPGDPWKYQTGVDRTSVQVTTVAPDPGHTTHLTVVDRDRNMVSLTSTLGASFGSAIVVPGTGILLNNLVTWFDPRPGTQNSIAPGRRVLWAGSPTLLTRDGRPLAALGAPGGRKIMSAVLQVIVNLVDFGMGMQDSVSAPRLHCEGPEITIESLTPSGTIDGLRELGHQVTVQTESFATSFFARPNGILIDPTSGRLRGGIDPFRPYYVMGV